MSHTSTDPIADMLTRIRNAINVRKNVITLPHSKVKESVAQLLAQNNFLDDVQVSEGATSKHLTITINKELEPARITEITRLSTPGRRIYVGADEIPIVKRGRGLVIVSTSKGIMSGVQAKTAGVGGELICRIY